MSDAYAKAERSHLSHVVNLFDQSVDHAKCLSVIGSEKIGQSFHIVAASTVPGHFCEIQTRRGLDELTRWAVEAVTSEVTDMSRECRLRSITTSSHRSAAGKTSAISAYTKTHGGVGAGA